MKNDYVEKLFIENFIKKNWYIQMLEFVKKNLDVKVNN